MHTIVCGTLTDGRVATRSLSMVNKNITEHYNCIMGETLQHKILWEILLLSI